MRKRILTLGAVLAAVTGLAIGGTALAASGSSTQSKAPVAEPAGQELPAAQEQPGVAETSQPGDTDAIQSQNGKDDPTEAANEQPGAETESANEQPGNDGPGGHADEPGNATADHQFQGVE